MRKTLCSACLVVLVLFLLLTCISCHSDKKNDLNMSKYSLAKYVYNNQEFNASEEYNYYYVFFDFESNEITIVYNKKSDNIEMESNGTFAITENMYIANIENQKYNFIFLDNNYLECNMYFVKCIFKLDK